MSGRTGQQAGGGGVDKVSAPNTANVVSLDQLLIRDDVPSVSEDVGVNDVDTHGRLRFLISIDVLS